MNEAHEREAFEAWAFLHGHLGKISCNWNGVCYTDERVQFAWLAWREQVRHYAADRDRYRWLRNYMPGTLIAMLSPGYRYRHPSKRPGVLDDIIDSKIALGESPAE